MNRLFFGGTLAIALLGLYIYSIIYALDFAGHCLPSCDLGDNGVAFLLQTIGALVSAVVVSELAVTSPTEVPGTRIADAIPAKANIVKWLASTYIIIWLLSGIVLVVLGWIQHPNTVPQLASAAREWLGYAIAAAYAYFGVTPNHH